MMDNFTGAAVHLEFRKSTEYEKKETSVQTEPLKNVDVGTDVIPRVEQSVQVNTLNENASVDKKLRLDVKIVDCIIQLLQLNVKEDQTLKKLNSLHTTSRIAIFHKKQVDLIKVNICCFK